MPLSRNVFAICCGFTVIIHFAQVVVFAQAENRSVMGGGMGIGMKTRQFSEDSTPGDAVDNPPLTQEEKDNLYEFPFSDETVEAWYRKIQCDLSRTSVIPIVELYKHDPTEEEKKTLPNREWGEPVGGASLTIWTEKNVYGFAEPVILYGQIRYERKFEESFPKSQDLSVRFHLDMTYFYPYQFPTPPRGTTVAKTSYGGQAMLTMGTAGAIREAGYVSPIWATFLNRHYDMSEAGTYRIRIRGPVKMSDVRDHENTAHSNELKIKIVNQPNEGEVTQLKSYPESWALDSTYEKNVNDLEFESVF